MLAKFLNIGIVVLWMASMSTLFVRDILPAWQAGDPPPTLTAAQLGHDKINRQAGIFDAQGRRIGTNWVQYISTRDLLTVKSTTLLERIAGWGPLRIQTWFTFRAQGVLDEFETRIFGAPFPITVKGENYDPDFLCELTVGDMSYQWRLDAETSRMLAETFKPFTLLRGLHVGQSWQMRVMDPVAAMTGRGRRFEAVLVRVVGKERIEHQGEVTECFRVEAPNMVAFVDADGEVLRQQVDVPVVGAIVILEEAFDLKALQAAKKRVPVFPLYVPDEDSAP